MDKLSALKWAGIAGFIFLVVSYLASVIFFALNHYDMDAAMPWSAWIALVAGTSPDQLFISFAVPTFAAVAFLIWLLGSPKKIFGDARWARSYEIKKAGLFHKKGIILGKIGGQYLLNDESGHVLVTAPTRAGKGVGLVIPNLLSWHGSAIILDIKQENFQITSGFKAEYTSGRVYLFAPAQANTHCFNPLDTVRRDYQYKISDIQRIATMLLPDHLHDSNPMWQREARDLFVGLALYVINMPGVPATIGEIHKMLKGHTPLPAMIQIILQQGGLDPACAASFNNFIGKAEKERSGVKSSLTAALSLWNNPVIAAATSKSDFDLAQLRKLKSAIYVGVTINDLKNLAPLINLFFQLAGDVLTRQMPQPDEPHSVLMLIDEFASLGRMDILADNMAFFAGYHIRMMNIIQGLDQLDELYKREGRGKILQNSAIQVFFATNDESTTQYVSQRMGMKTISTTTKNTPRSMRLTEMGSRSASVTKREFMLPEEVRTFDKNKIILFKEGTRPIKATKIRYYDDRTFTSRIKSPVSVPELKISMPNAAIIDIEAAKVLKRMKLMQEQQESVAIASEVNEITDILSTSSQN